MPGYGDIILVDSLLDPNGVNPKTRPCVVITTDADLAAGAPIVVAAISTLLPGPPPPDAVPMRYHPRGHPRTGLRTRCAAFATWLATVGPGRVVRTIGHVPTADLLALAATLDRLAGPDPGAGE